MLNSLLEVLSATPENIAGELGASGILKIVKPILGLLSLLSPWLRRQRMTLSRFADRLIPAESEEPFVTLRKREFGLDKLFKQRPQYGQPVLRTGVFVVHGSINAGKRMWVVQSLLRTDCDPYQIEADKLFVKNANGYVKGRDGNFVVTPRLSGFLRGISFSLIGIPRHKAFLVELSPDTSTDEIHRMYRTLHKFQNASEKKEYPITFILKAAGFMSPEDEASANDYICLETLVPTECVEFVEHEVWTKQVSAEVKERFTDQSLRAVVRYDLPEFVRLQYARNLWVSTLGQPVRLYETIKAVAAENEWQKRIEMIPEDIRPRAIAFLTLLALLADLDGENERDFSPAELAEACDITASEYVRLVDIIKKNHRFNLLAHPDIRRDQIVCPAEDAEEDERKKFVFDNRYQASALLLKWGRFGKTEEHLNFYAAMGIVANILMSKNESDLVIVDEDLLRAGRNLARAIIKNRPWIEWRTEFERFSKDTQVAKVPLLSEAFQAEFERLSREEGFFSNLERCVDVWAPDQMTTFLNEVLASAIPNDRDYLETLARSLVISDENRAFPYYLNFDFARLHRIVKSDRPEDRDLLTAIALIYLVPILTVRDDLVSSSGWAGIRDMIEIAMCMRDRLVPNALERRVLTAVLRFMETGTFDDDDRAFLEGVLRDPIKPPDDPYLSEALAIAFGNMVDPIFEKCLSHDGVWCERWLATKGFAGPRIAYWDSLSFLSKNATADDWTRIAERLNGDLKPRTGDLYQRRVFIKTVTGLMPIMPPTVRDEYFTAFLLEQKDLLAGLDVIKFGVQFRALGFSLRLFGSPAQQKEFLKMLECAYFKDDFLDGLVSSWRQYAMYFRLLKDLSMLNFDDPELKDQSRVINLAWILAQVGALLLQRYTGWSDAYKEEQLSEFRADDQAAGRRTLVQNEPELFYYAAHLLSFMSLPEGGYPDDKECLRVGRVMFNSLTMDGNPDVNLVLHWIEKVQGAVKGR